MKEKRKKIVLLENKHQTNAFLKKIENFREFIPITFSFEVEQLLDTRQIKYEMEENYEDNKIYREIHQTSIKATNKICNKLRLYYRGVDLFKAFYYDIYLLVSSSKKYLRLLQKIIKQKRPTEVITFENSKFSYHDKEYCRFILKKVFNGRSIINKYSANKNIDIRERTLIKIAGILQKFYAKFHIFLSGKSSNNIFVYGGKTYFESVCKGLMKNKKNRIFNFDGFLRKSYFIGRKYLPFYEFSGIYSKNQNILMKKINILKNQIFNLKFSKEFGTEKEIEEILKYKICSLMDRKFKQISKQVEEFYQLMKKGKINLILNSADSVPLVYAMVMLAKSFKIPSVIAQHGFFNHEIGYRSISDYILASGEKIKQEYVYYGTEEDKVKVVGCPRYDVFTPPRFAKQSKKIIFYGMEVTNGNEIVADTHLSKKRQKEILRVLFKALKMAPEYKLVVKSRPNWEMANLPKKIADEEGFTNLKVIEKGDNIELMNNSDLIIINRSTLGIEALLLNRPVVSIYYKDLDLYNPFYETDFVQKIYNTEQVNHVISKLRRKSLGEIKRIRDKLNTYFLVDGNSTKMAVKLIENILKDQR